MYRYRYINKHKQFGQVSYTLILEDLEGDCLQPTIRIEKSFSIAEGMVDTEFLYNEAKQEIIRVLFEQKNQIPIEENESTELNVEEEGS